jgi:hypothetical protein
LKPCILRPFVGLSDANSLPDCCAIDGLDISEGALVDMLDAARRPFAKQTSLIRARLLSGTARGSDEIGVRVGDGKGGYGSSTTRTALSSSPIPRAAKAWFRLSWRFPA